jgi:hypothetical protein
MLSEPDLLVSTALAAFISAAAVLVSLRIQRRRLARFMQEQNATARRRFVSSSDRFAAASLQAARTQALEDLANDLAHNPLTIPGDPLLKARPRPVRFSPSRRQLRAARARVLPAVQRLGHGPIIHADLDWDTLSITLVSRTARVPLVLLSSTHLVAASELAFRLQHAPLNYLVDAKDGLMTFHFLADAQEGADITLRGYLIPRSML